MMRTLILAVLCTSVVPAQFTPIVAKHRERTYLITADGKKTVRGNAEGVFLRSSSGMQLETKQRTSADARGPGATEANFVDAATGKMYHADYSSRVKYVVGDRQLPLRPRTDFHTMLRAAKYNGVPCVMMPVGQHPDGVFRDHKAIVCVSRDYDVPVYMEFARTAPDGTRAVQIIENYDLQVGVEPPTPQFTEVMGFREIPSPYAPLATKGTPEHQTQK